MIYSHKTDTKRRNLNTLEKSKVKKLQKSKPAAWMIEDKVN